MPTVLTDSFATTAIEAAIRAPSMHNSQPWRFRLRDGAIEVLADRSRQLPIADPTGWAVHIACGAAVYNLRLAFAVHGTPAVVQLRPDPTQPDLMARVVPGKPRPATPTERSLYAAIPRRRSNRAPFWPEPTLAEDRTRLIEAARAEGGWLEMVIGPLAVAAVAEIARAANRMLERNPEYLAELRSWVRGGGHVGNGIPTEAAGPRGEPHDLLPQRPFGDSPRAPGRDFEPEPLVAVLGTHADTPTDQLVAGEALQAVLLTATDAGLAVSMLSQPIEVPSAREQLRRGLGRFGVPQMVMRIGYGQPQPGTPRRPVAEVLA
ncbi:MAG TPA: nitroreductase [Micromonosporaceae bacterium]